MRLARVNTRGGRGGTDDPVPQFLGEVREEQEGIWKVWYLLFFVNEELEISRVTYTLPYTSGIRSSRPSFLILCRRS
jgi:hypothetical protein